MNENKKYSESFCISGEHFLNNIPVSITGNIRTDSMEVPVVSGKLEWRDIFSGWKVRWGMGRNKSTVEPGIYAAGRPDKTSPVIVTSNYSLTFDTVRSSLSETDCWILVLDTKGINVWCAAGKGTFGTVELVKRIKSVCLENIVTHRELIVPQLGATGISAHDVRNFSGFRVVYGPVRASDIPEFLMAGKKADDSMRQVSFKVGDRLKVVPVELVQSLKFLPLLFIYSLVFSMGDKSGESVFIRDFLLLSGSLFAGTLFVPVFLPFIPGRWFALKGWFTGVFYTISAGFIFKTGLIDLTGNFLVFPAVASFFALNFTGATTFTSPSGVKKEMKYAIPAIIIMIAAGTAVNILDIFF